MIAKLFDSGIIFFLLQSSICLWPKIGRNPAFEKHRRKVTEVYVLDPFKVTSFMDFLKNLFQVDNKFRPLKEARIVSVTIHANPIAE